MNTPNTRSLTPKQQDNLKPVLQMIHDTQELLSERTIGERLQLKAGQVKRHLEKLSEMRLIAYSVYPETDERVRYHITRDGRYALRRGTLNITPDLERMLTFELERLGVPGAFTIDIDHRGVRGDSSTKYHSPSWVPSYHKSRSPELHELLEFLSPLPDGAGPLVVDALIQAFDHGYEEGHFEGREDGRDEAMMNEYYS
jgi:DNA-binding MarR family transcriptional regulator